MTFKTMADLITEVEQALYQSAGPQVQLYSQDIIQQMIQDAYTHIVCGDEWWPRTIVRETRTLNGTTGQFTVPLTYITDYNDVKAVFRPGSRRPLPILPPMQGTAYIINGTARYIEAIDSDTQPFRVWPLDATDTLEVVGRVSAAALTYDGIVPFDSLVLKHFACWSYFVDDESMASAEKHRMLFENRRKTLRNNAFSQPILLDPNTDAIPDRWTETG